MYVLKCLVYDYCLFYWVGTSTKRMRQGQIIMESHVLDTYARKQLSLTAKKMSHLSSYWKN